MTKVFLFRLTLLFSLSGTAMEGNGGFWQSSLAAETGVPALRSAYIAEVKGLEDLGLAARAAGQDLKSTAQLLNTERNALKVQYRQLGSPDDAARFAARNMEKYGNPVGPTVEQLRENGKTLEQIIESAARPGGSDLGF
jgi:hypothetical protein